MIAEVSLEDCKTAAKVELAKREYDRRNLAELAKRLESFEYFAEYISQRFGKRDYKHYPFSRYLCNRFEEWSKTNRGRLKVNMPPRVGKTENCIVLGILYVMCFVNRRASVGYVTYGSSLSKEKSEAIREIYREFVESDIGVYLNLAPISKTTAAKQHWATTEGFEMQAAGLGGSWTGREFDFLFVDDPYKNHEEALSPTGRKKVWLYWQGSLGNRLAPNAKVLLIHTRWHEEDLTSKIEETETFDSVVFSALAKENDPLGRALDEPLLCRFTDVDKNYWQVTKKSKTSFFWESQYQQAPGDFTGQYFGKISIGPWSALAKVVAFLDTSFDGLDTTALAIGGRLSKDNYQVEGHTWPGNVTDCEDAIVVLIQARRIKTIVIEKNADHGAFAKQLRKRLKKDKISCIVVDETERTNKHARIVTHVYANQERITYSEESDAEFMAQIKRYDEGVKPCDAPDAVAGLMRRLTKQVRRFF